MFSSPKVVQRLRSGRLCVHEVAATPWTSSCPDKILQRIDDISNIMFCSVAALGDIVRFCCQAFTFDAQRMSMGRGA